MRKKRNMEWIQETKIETKYKRNNSIYFHKKNFL